MKRWGLLGVVFVLLLAGCGSNKPKAAPRATAVTHTLIGSILLTDVPSVTEDVQNGSPCTSPDGYSDIAAGASVTVSNQSGTILALGQLGYGMATGLFNCSFPFTVKGIPAAAFYQVEVTHRGETAYSASQLAADDWIISLSLGSN